MAARDNNPRSHHGPAEEESPKVAVPDTLEELQAQGLRATMEAMIKEHGWCLLGVPAGDPRVPMGTNIQTRGFETNFSHPELQIVFPLDPQIAHDVLSNFAERIRKGEKFRDGEVVQGVLGAGYPCKLIRAIASGRELLRIVLPDGDHHLEKADLDGDFLGQYEMLDDGSRGA